MKILVLSSKFPYPLKDGGAIATFNLLSGLSNNGHKITLLSFNTKKHYFNPKNFPKNKIPTLSIHDIYINTTPKIFSAIHNLLFSTKPYILTRFSNKNFYKKLENLLQNNSFDIIQIEGLYLLQYISFIRKKSTALIAYRAHNIEHEIWSKLSDNKIYTLKKLYFKNLSKRIKKYEQTIINQYDLLIPISSNDEIFFKNLANKKPIHISSVGFEILQANNAFENKQSKHIYFIGSLDWLPNQEAILWFINNCWFDINRQYPDLKLFIAGRNAPKSFVKKIQYPNIIFEGEIENISDFINDKKIMIVPLLSGSGMRVKIIEAFTQKKAVISTKLGAVGTKSTHNKHILIAETKQEFIEKINLLLSDENLYQKIINNAYDLVSENFNNFEISKSLAQFYTAQLKKTKKNASANF